MNVYMYQVPWYLVLYYSTVQRASEQYALPRVLCTLVPACAQKPGTWYWRTVGRYGTRGSTKYLVLYMVLSYSSSAKQRASGPPHRARRYQQQERVTERTRLLVPVRKCYKYKYLL